MVIVETIGRIRREHFVKGKTIREISRDLKISRNTVRKILRSKETSFSYGRVVQPRPKLKKWSTDLDRILKENAGKSARERRTLILIYEELRGLGYLGGYDAVRRYAPGAAIYVCGGGAHNTALIAALAALTAPNRVASTLELGLDPDFVEAIAFAWFAKRTLQGLPSSAASVTGAKGARVLGGVYAPA